MRILGVRMLQATAPDAIALKKDCSQGVPAVRAAEAVRANSPLERGCASMLCCGAFCAILLTASAAQASIASRHGIATAAGAASTLLRTVASRTVSRGPGNFADLAEKVAPAVIGVSATVASPRDQSSPSQSFEFGRPDRNNPESKIPGPGAPDQGKLPGGKEVTVGSGFFISADGYAVTNSHVVENSDIAQIRTNDDKIYQAKVVGTDRLSDLALIKVDGRTDFSYVTLADQLPRVGDWVLAVGNPFGLRGTVTAGIVSARERTIAAASPEDLIQIDAPINQGDSGGPTFDTSGNVIGVNSMIFSPSGGSVGVSFAIPADTVKKVVAQLRDTGTVTRGWIGVEAQTITPDLADGLGRSNLHGAIVASVQRDSPAAKAGLASGDVITSISGSPIKDANDLAKKIHGMAPGSLAQLSLFREGNERSITVALGQLPN